MVCVVVLFNFKRRMHSFADINNSLSDICQLCGCFYFTWFCLEKHAGNRFCFGDIGFWNLILLWISANNTIQNIRTFDEGIWGMERKKKPEPDSKMLHLFGCYAFGCEKVFIAMANLKPQKGWKARFRSLFHLHSTHTHTHKPKHIHLQTHTHTHTNVWHSFIH